MYLNPFPFVILAYILHQNCEYMYLLTLPRSVGRSVCLCEEWRTICHSSSHWGKYIIRSKTLPVWKLSYCFTAHVPGPIFIPIENCSHLARVALVFGCCVYFRTERRRGRMGKIDYVINRMVPLLILWARISAPCDWRFDERCGAAYARGRRNCAAGFSGRWSNSGKSLKLYIFLQCFFECAKNICVVHNTAASVSLRNEE